MTPLVLSDREAAKLLRVDRCSTLQEFKRRGDLTVIPWGRGTRITLESVQALARRGWTETGRPVRAVSRPRRAAPAPGVGNRIRAIEVTS
jgi:hypothetical protein